MKERIKNDLSQKFNKTTVWIHWLTALIIFVLILSSFKLLGFDLVERLVMIVTHLLLGSLIFIFTATRTYLLFSAEQPEHLKTGSKFIDKLAVWNHYFFYLLLLVISVMGVLAMLKGNYIEGLFVGLDNILPQAEIPILKLHVLLSFILLLNLIIHILGVIKHYIFTRENTLKRII